MKSSVVMWSICVMAFAFVLGCVFIFLGFDPNCYNPDGFKVAGVLLLAVACFMIVPIGIACGP